MASTNSDDSAVLRVLSTLAVKGAMPALEDSFMAARGARLETTFAPTQGLLEAIGTGVRGDVAILTRDGCGPLVEAGVLDRWQDFAMSYVGLAVKAGVRAPDISTPEALIATLEAAGSIAFSKIGASGLYFAGLIERLGIADMVRAKARIVSGGFTGAEVAAGRAEIAIQQVSELKVVPGLTVVGALPKQLQEPSVFSVARFKEAQRPELATAFIEHFGRPETLAVLVSSGLEPIG